MSSSSTTTPPTVRSVLDALDDARRAGSEILIAAMQAATDMPPALLPGTIIGFGSYDYRYASGREGTSCALGFSPRAREFSLYLSCYLDQDATGQQALFDALGRHRLGKGCLYLKDPRTVAPDALAAVLQASLRSLINSPVVTAVRLGPNAHLPANE
ncbi:MAG: hypothetical protein WBA46_08875 [Thermomicrobiales bacterium]